VDLHRREFPLGCSKKCGIVECLASTLANLGVDDMPMLIQLDTNENGPVAGLRIIRLYLVDGFRFDHHGTFVVVGVGDDLWLNVFWKKKRFGEGMRRRFEKIDGKANETNLISLELDKPRNLLSIPWLKVLIRSGIGVRVSGVEKIVGIEPISLTGDRAVPFVDLAASYANHVFVLQLLGGNRIH